MMRQPTATGHRTLPRPRALFSACSIAAFTIATLTVACRQPEEVSGPKSNEVSVAVRRSSGAVIEGKAPTASGGLPSVVYLQALQPQADPPPANSAFVDQVGGQFFPQVQLAMVGQPVRFTNAESELHNVQAITIATGDTEFNVTTPPFADPYEHTFSQPGVARLTCGIHPGMLGYLIVSPGPWAAVAAADGAVRIDGIPAGSYRLVVWNADPEAAWEAEVALEDDSNVSLGDLRTH